MPKLMVAPPHTPSSQQITSDEQILDLLAHLRDQRGPVLEKMREVRDTYHGDIALPLPELDGMERPAVVNLLNVGLDGHAGRIGSTSPGIRFEALENTKAARQRARHRTDVIYSWWKQSAIPLKRFRIARHWCGYGSTFIYLRPDSTLLCPRYVIRNPLNTYYVGEIDEDLALERVIFTSRSAGRWIADQYPGTDTRLRAMAGDGWQDIDFELVEYVDRDEWVFLAKLTGEQYNAAPWNANQGGEACIHLDRLPNRIGICPVVPGGRFGLDRVIGQFEQMTGMFVTQAELQALEIIATRRDVFPDIYLESVAGQVASIIQPADGITGQIGIVAGGQLKPITHAPGYQTNTTIDRLERNQRATGRIPPEFAGESGTSIRTGRRGDAVMSSTVDFNILEAQTTMAAMFGKANELAIEIDLAYYGPRTKTIWVGSTGKTKVADRYTPDELWETNRHDVTYSHPGTDASQLTIATMQLVGAQMLSKRSGMEMHPMIEDAEKESDRIVAETLEQAMIASLSQQAQAGQIPPADLARIMSLVRDEDVDLAEAVQQVQREAQERQATQVPASDPGAMPGLAQPGAGAEMSPIPEPPQGSRNLLSLLTTSRLPQMSIGAEQGPMGGAAGIQPGFAG